MGGGTFSSLSVVTPVPSPEFSGDDAKRRAVFHSDWCDSYWMLLRTAHNPSPTFRVVRDVIILAVRLEKYIFNRLYFKGPAVVTTETLASGVFFFFFWWQIYTTTYVCGTTRPCDLWQSLGPSIIISRFIVLPINTVYRFTFSLCLSNVNVRARSTGARTARETNITDDNNDVAAAAVTHKRCTADAIDFSVQLSRISYKVLLPIFDGVCVCVRPLVFLFWLSRIKEATTHYTFDVSNSSSVLSAVAFVKVAFGSVQSILKDASL